MPTPPLSPATSAELLTTLLLCALLGLLGQGTRAAITLKGVAAFDTGKPGAQSTFNASFFALSMMIGAIAGILAGLSLGLDKLMSFDPGNIKVLLGIAVAGYAGVDFVENAFSRVLPGAQSPPAGDVQPRVGAPAALSPAAARLPEAVAPAPDTAYAAASPPLQEALAIVAPAVKPSIWVPALQAAFTRFDMNTNKRMAAAIGQFLVEAGAGFQPTIENLDYRTAERIADVFKGEFPNAAAAAPYVGHPEALGNYVYANRLGNGDTDSGDGFLFRGRGLIQLTGRDTYTAFAKTLNMTPQQAAAYCETAEGAAVSGCWFLASHGCLPLADRWALSEITARVAGPGMGGNAQRVDYANRMLKALGG
jgi:predicted chitinase